MARMTEETRLCLTCQQPVTANTTVCPTCNTTIRWDDLWPEWHGAPTTTNGDESGWGSPPPADVPDDYQALPLDPKLVDAQISRPGKRSMVALLVVSAVSWFLVTLLYERGNPAAYWDYIWFALAVLTIVLGLWLLVLLVRRATTHGVGAAVRWLVS